MLNRRPSRLFSPANTEAVGAAMRRVPPTTATMNRYASCAPRQTLPDSHRPCRRSLRNEKVRGANPLSSANGNLPLIIVTESFTGRSGLLTLHGAHGPGKVDAGRPSRTPLFTTWLDGRLTWLIVRCATLPDGCSLSASSRRDAHHAKTFGPGGPRDCSRGWLSQALPWRRRSDLAATGGSHVSYRTRGKWIDAYRSTRRARVNEGDGGPTNLGDRYRR